jgi:hypothetical protein
VWLAEQGINMAGWGGGKALGAATGFATPLPGGTVAGEVLGGAAGMTGADTVNQYIDHYLYGAPVDVSTKALIKDFAINAASSYGTETVIKNLPAIINKVAPHLGAVEPYASKAAQWLGGIPERVKGGVEQELQEAVSAGGGIKRAYEEKVLPTMVERPEGAPPDVAPRLEGPLFEKAADIQKKAIAAEEPSARLALIEKETGATPETAARAKLPPLERPAPGEVSSPTEAALLKQQELRNTYHDIHEASMESWKRQYEGVLKDHMKLPGNGELPLQEILNQEAYKTQAINPHVFDTETKRLMAVGKDIFGFDPDKLTAEEQKYITGHANTVKVSAIDPETGKGTFHTQVEMPANKGDPATLVDITDPNLTAGKLLHYSRWAGNVAAHAPSEIDAKAATAIENKTKAALEASLQDHPEVMTKLKALDQRYRPFKLDYDRPTARAIWNAQNTVQASQPMFSDPQLLSRLGADSTPAQKKVLYEHFGNYIVDNPERWLTTNPAEAIPRAESLKEIAPNSPFANPKSLMHVSGELENLRAVPGAVERVTASADRDIQKMLTQSAAAARDHGIAQLRKLGPVGENTLREVAAAKNPQEQAQIIDKFFSGIGRQGQGMAQKIGQAQKIWGGQLVPRQIVKDLGVETPQPWMLRQAGRPGAAPWYAVAGGLGGLMFGRLSPFWTMMAGVGGTISGYRMIQKAILKSLTGEEVAPMMSALTHRSYDQIGSILAKAGERDIVRNLSANIAAGYGREKLGNPLQAPPTPRPGPEMRIGPMSKDIERKQAVAMSTERGREDPGHVDQVQDLNKQIAQGRTPNIHQDLNSGRLSNSEVRQMVANTGPASPADLFKNMSLPDAIDAFSRGTRDEKALALAPLSQKLNDEGRNLRPEQRRALMAQLQRAMGPTGGAMA